jgi:Ni,Fe-hydrogenase III large subunit/Ni,Fe-hydrogenase III component G
MRIPGIDLDLQSLAAPVPVWRGEVDAAGWSSAAHAVAESGGRLVALWGSDRRRGIQGNFVLSAAYALPAGLVWLDLPMSNAAGYPDISSVFPCAARMQRACADLLGIQSVGEDTPDTRPWFNHGSWPAGYFPLRKEFTGQEAQEWPPLIDYPFVRVEGDGVHEIAVGPVHAGIIEPGHFRFSVVGEKVMRLEERLGYTHKGIEKRFEHFAPREGYRLASRVSGDSTVAYAWSYCMALESIERIEIPARAAWLRALMLERERVANHLGDLGALANDAAFSFGLAQFMVLKEDWLRLNKVLFGHRFMMDRVVPGGVAIDLDADGKSQLHTQCKVVEQEVRRLHTIYEDHAGMQDRFIATGRVTQSLATQLGLTGMAGRASGLHADLRSDFSLAPYDRLQFRAAHQQNGDVAARVAVRFEEVFESLRLLRRIATELPEGAATTPLGESSPSGFGAGWVEGWRGEIFVALDVEGGRIRRCHCHDPSWQNWPVLEHAVMGNIVPDFPVINKSFNLSYSGHDL